jgi:hypothetical protein
MQDSNQSNVSNLNYVKREASIKFRNKKEKHVKANIDKLGINSKSKISETCYTGIYEALPAQN